MYHKSKERWARLVGQCIVSLNHIRIRALTVDQPYICHLMHTYKITACELFFLLQLLSSLTCKAIVTLLLSLLCRQNHDAQEMSWAKFVGF